MMEDSPPSSDKASQTIAPADTASVRRAADILLKGGLVALPTETVYGLAADATSPEAVARIFKAKGRPQFNPLICHVPGRKAAAQLVDIPPLADHLIDAFWPGPLTLVLEKLPDAPVADAVCAGLSTLAVRAPAHALIRQVLKATGRPLAAPSANKSGRISPTTAQHVADDMGRDVDMILDGGPCHIGLESTIVSVIGDTITLLRPGAITDKAIESATGVHPQKPDNGSSVSAPGQLLSHYAPRASIRLQALDKKPDEILIGFGDIEGDFNLSPEGNPEEAAARLFATLRAADALAREQNKTVIAIAPIPATGLGLAINDRLRRAAAPKDSKPDNAASHGEGQNKG